jgi:hypothetical protein
LEKFKASPLPVPPPGPDQQYFTQLIRIIGLYFSQLDSLTPNQAQSYRADAFYGGDFLGDTVTADTVTAGQFNGGDFDGVEANFARLYSGLISGNFQGGNGVFNNLTASTSNASLFTGSGRQLNFPHIAASDSTDQYADGDNDPTIVKWDAADSTLGFTLNNDYTATATYDGIYKIDYSLQFANTDNAAHDVFVWLKVDGSDVAKSSSKFTLPARKSVGDYSFVVAYSSVTFSINAGQSVGLWWATDKAYSTTGPVDGVYMEYLAAQSAPPYARPVNPSAIGSIVYVSAPDPTVTRVVPIGVVGVGGIGTPVVTP